MFHRRYSNCQPQNAVRYESHNLSNSRKQVICWEAVMHIARLCERLCTCHWTPPPPFPTSGRCGALATRQNNSHKAPYQGTLFCENPNDQMRINFPTQGASSVSLSPMVSYLWCGEWCMVWRVDPTGIRARESVRDRQRLCTLRKTTPFDSPNSIRIREKHWKHLRQQNKYKNCWNSVRKHLQWSELKQN